MVEPIRTTVLNMEKVATDDLFDYYEAEIQDKYTRVCYYFELSDRHENLFYIVEDLLRKLNAIEFNIFSFHTLEEKI